MTDQQLLRAADVSRLLNISKRQVYRLADAGHLPGRVKLGKLTRWDREAIEKWIKAGCPVKQQRPRGKNATAP